MKTTLIAFCGAKGSGKDTSAGIFKDLVATEVKEIAFAGHLKQTCSKVFNIDMKYFTDPKLKEKELENYVRLTPETIEAIFQEFEITNYTFDDNIRPHLSQVFDTPRKLLQYVGTELLHPIDKLIHVNFALKKVDLNKISLVTDLRFPQEFDVLHGNENYLLVYVSNLQAENVAATDTHPSEQGWKYFKTKCIQLDNNGTLADLANNIKELIESRVK